MTAFVGVDDAFLYPKFVSRIRLKWFPETMNGDTLGEMEMEARRLAETMRAIRVYVDATDVARRTLAGFPQVAGEFVETLAEYVREYLEGRR
jgi:hypothetical protein